MGLPDQRSRQSPRSTFLLVRKVACTVQLCNGPCSPNGITRYKTSRIVRIYLANYLAQVSNIQLWKNFTINEISE